MGKHFMHFTYKRVQNVVQNQPASKQQAIGSNPIRFTSIPVRFQKKTETYFFAYLRNSLINILLKSRFESQADHFYISTL
jgi:hypothetical protein